VGPKPRKALTSVVECGAQLLFCITEDLHILEGRRAAMKEFRLF
jgi:hypothetical protein